MLIENYQIFWQIVKILSNGHSRSAESLKPDNCCLYKIGRSSPVRKEKYTQMKKITPYKT